MIVLAKGLKCVELEIAVCDLKCQVPMTSKSGDSHETCHRVIINLVGWNQVQMERDYSTNAIAQERRFRGQRIPSISSSSSSDKELQRE